MLTFGFFKNYPNIMPVVAFVVSFGIFSVMRLFRLLV